MPGIRQLVLEPESDPEKDKGYKDYPSQYDNDYDSGYGSYGKGSRFDDDEYYKTKDKYFNDKEDPSRIVIGLTITTKEMGHKYDWRNNDESYILPEEAEERAKELAYDKLVNLLGKEFEAKFTMIMDAIDGVDEYTVNITLTPNKK